MNKCEMIVNDAYNTILLRSPDKSGIDTYVKHVSNGMTFEILKSSQEYLDLRKSIDTIICNLSKSRQIVHMKSF